MKLADYVIDFLSKQGIRHNFLVSGGAVIHLVDSTSRHPQMQYICGQHEEHSAAAADMYARVTGNLGVVMTTSGPGATNIVTSVSSAFFDSVPMLCITGQVSRFRIKKSKKLRQKGFQETDVISIFKSITKYAKLVLDPLSIRYELEKAIYLAKEGRPGPVLLDIPDDLQRVEIDPAQLKGFIPPAQRRKNLKPQIQTLAQWIQEAKKPVLIFGMGIQCAKAMQEAVRFAETLQIPVVCTWGGADLLPHTHPLKVGGIGVCGPRAGNFAVQSADLVIALGTRLSPMVTGGKQDLFAPRAKKVVIDIDGEELQKFGPETFVLDLAIQTDLKEFFRQWEALHPVVSADRYTQWRELIQSWKQQYPVYPLAPIPLEGPVQPHLFLQKVSALAAEGSILIGDTGANLAWIMQSFESKIGQRIFSAWNHTPMGYSLPASIGAALASKQEVVCFIGDGGFMMCLQELGTIRRLNLPIRIFLFNNRGHSIQKQTIDTWLHSHYAAVNEETGLYFPDYEKIAAAFEIPFFQLKKHKDLDLLPKIWEHRGPFFCDVQVSEEQKIVPMLKFGSGIEDLEPKIGRDELHKILQEALKMDASECAT